MTTRTSRKAARQKAAEMRREAERRERRRRRLTTAAIVGGAAIVGAAMIVAATLSGSGDDDEVAVAGELADVSGLGAEALPPWPAPADVSARVAAAGLPLGPEGTVEHYHAHLDVIVDGEPVAVPPNIGVDVRSGSMSELHTHESDGVVHVEASQKGQTFTLGQLFTEWDVRLTADQVGGLESGGANTLAVYVNGEKVDGIPALIKLQPHQEIAVAYGPPDHDVDVPDRYDFPPGE